MNRRNFLKKSLLTAAVFATTASLLVRPKKTFAAWPKKSFFVHAAIWKTRCDNKRGN